MVPGSVPPYAKNPEIPGSKPPEKPAEQREAAKQGAAQKRADISLETLEKRTSADNTEQLINSINPLESPEKQRENIDALTDVATILLVIAGHADVNIIEKFRNFENVPLLEQHLGKLKPPESAALKKLRELRENLASPTSRHLQEQWGAVIEGAKKIQPQIVALRNWDGRTKPPDKPSGVIDTAIKLASEHKIATGVILIGGAIGLYALFRKIFPSKEESGEKKEAGKETESKGGFWKWLVGIGASIGAIFGLGRVLGMDGAKIWLKEKLGWDVNESRMAQALILISKGEFKKAAEMLWEGADGNHEFNAKMAEKISKETGDVKISGKTLFELKNASFEKFISRAEQLKDEAGITARENTPAVLQPIVSLLTDTEQKNKEQIALRGFFKNHESEIRKLLPVQENTTIEDVLKALDRSGGTAAAAAGGIAAAGVGATGEQPAPNGTATPEKMPTSPITLPSSPREEYKQRETIIGALSEKNRVRAIKNEEFLKEKIDFSQLQTIKRAIEKTERALRALKDSPTKNLKADEREKVNKKLKQLSEQKQTLAELEKKHAEAYIAYLTTLRSNPENESAITESFAKLIETKELLEEHTYEIFKREGWTELEFLTIVHGVKLGNFVYKRWFKKVGDLKTDYANYLFDKWKDRISPSRIKVALQEVFKKNTPRTIAEIETAVDTLIADSEKFGHKLFYEETADKRRLTADHWKQIDELEDQIKFNQKELDRLWEAKNRELKEALKAGTSTDAILEEVKRVGTARAKMDFGAAKTCGTWFERWRAAFKGDPGIHKDIYDQGVNRFRNFFRETLRLKQSGLGSKVLLGGGKLAFLGASIYIGGEVLSDEKTGKIDAYKQAGLSILPVYGSYLDFYSAFAGKEKFTGRKLDVTDRAISGLFGVAGVASDVLTVFGIGVAGRAALTAVKTGRGLSRGARVMKAVEAAKDAKSAAKAYKTYQVLDTAGKWGFRVSLGTALGVPAYMAYQTLDTLEVSNEFIEHILTGMNVETAST